MTTTRPDLAVEHDGSSSMWTSRLRWRWMSTLPPDKLLPDRQPAYVASWIYVFGVLTLAAFMVILLSGLVLSFVGPAWVPHIISGQVHQQLAHLERAAVLHLHGHPPPVVRHAGPRGSASGRRLTLSSGDVAEYTRTGVRRVSPSRRAVSRRRTP
ncbi:MAG TPA: hypothetical protein VHR39_01495 [Propionibacteriaceae bacterium]|jgi:hypothetical protein|nr:hypothetical protein [Propionibacteriaceae bacterium]